MKNKTKLSVGRCKGCKKLWKEDQLVPVEFVHSAGDGLLRNNTFLCKDCHSSLELGLETQKTKREQDI